MRRELFTELSSRPRTLKITKTPVPKIYDERDNANNGARRPEHLKANIMYQIN
ncbi:MAG: hypothetical protein PWR31_847 [Bacillota bacterium]|nr:hypothetical protein [Bacillota bacterium]